MDKPVVTCMVCAFLGLVGSAHATDQGPAAPAQSAPSPSAEPDQKSTGIKPHDPPPDPQNPVDEDMLEYLDILVEMKVLESLETIETLQAVGAEEDEP